MKINKYVDVLLVIVAIFVLLGTNAAAQNTEGRRLILSGFDVTCQGVDDPCHVFLSCCASLSCDGWFSGTCH